MPTDISIGLLRSDGSEPPVESGYKRAALGKLEISQIPGISQIVFPDVHAPGYGTVTAFGAFYTKDGEDTPPLSIWLLPEPVNAHPGTVPVLHSGRLLLGVDVTANVAVTTMDVEDCE